MPGVRIKEGEVMAVEKYFKDLWYYVVAEPGEYKVEYKIYEVEGQGKDGDPFFHRAGEASHPSSGEVALADAEIYAQGHVKWDGCSNWNIDEQERVMLHFCTKEQILNLGRVMAECWDMTAELCEHWDGE